jgi:hypothetical protein
MSLISFDAIPSLPDAERAETYRVVRALAGYARGEHELDAPVQEYLSSLVPLYLAALGQAGEPDGEELTTELGVVIHAAGGREALERKPPRKLPAPTLSTLQLAALGGMAQRAVAALCRAGELEAEQDANGWRASAKEARRWLATRTQ